jgi:hypothetical protein
MLEDALASCNTQKKMFINEKRVKVKSQENLRIAATPCVTMFSVSPNF